MRELFILIGLPASGKTTFANIFNKSEDVVVLSSDAIREELFDDINDQTNNKLVFDTLHKRAREALLDGKDVIYDATSLTKDIRANIIKEVGGEALAINCLFFDVSLKQCLRRNKKRDRKVPKKVIKDMAKRLEKPTKDEGFDYVLLH